MKEEDALQAQKTFIKLIVCLQASLELFDELEDTNFYRHDLKRAINLTKKAVEKGLDGTHRFINSDEKEETYLSIERGVHDILDTSVEQLFTKGYKPLNTVV